MLYSFTYRNEYNAMRNSYLIGTNAIFISHSTNAIFISLGTNAIFISL